MPNPKNVLLAFPANLPDDGARVVVFYHDAENPDEEPDQFFATFTPEETGEEGKIPAFFTDDDGFDFAAENVTHFIETAHPV